MEDLSGATFGGGAEAGGRNGEPWSLAEGNGLGGYRVVRPLGRGGMGEVYEAEHVELGRRVALKLMRPEVVARPGFAARFRQEGRALARLDHPGIVEVFDMRSDEGRLFIVTEYISGPEGEPLSLAGELEAQGPLPEDEVRRLALEMCDALGAAHAAGVLHRDLKPGNVLLDRERRATLTDFGLAKLVGAGPAGAGPDGVDLSAAETAAYPQTIPGSVLGTPEYMSPEQASGGEVDERSDIYSLGVMIYHMLTGKRALGRFRMPSRLGCSALWDDVIDRALAPEPDERHASAAELAGEIEAAGAGAAPQAAPGEDAEDLAELRAEIGRDEEEAVRAAMMGKGSVHYLTKVHASRRDLWRRAAEAGLAGGQWLLGRCHAEGLGVEKDAAEAVKWYRRAAEQGHALGQNILGLCYGNGTGVTRDRAEAVKWYRMAAEQGHALAQFNLGMCYDNGKGVTQDHAEAAKWFRKAAEQGDADAQLNLGMRYDKGEGVTQDYAEAASWYRKAAEQGHWTAQHNLGFFYYKGRGVSQDDVEAVKWFRKAAEQGCVDSQFNLGVCYEAGTGVTQDDAEAVRWYRKAAEQGFEKAKEELRRRGYDP